MASLSTAGASDDGFFCSKVAKFDLCGELEYEFVDTELDKNNGIDEVNGHFQLDKFVLQPKITFDDYLVIKAYIYTRGRREIKSRTFCIE